MVGLTLLSCVAELDTSRDKNGTPTFGEVVATLLCKRVAFLADVDDGNDTIDVSGNRYRGVCATNQVPVTGPGALIALQTQRPALVEAIDTVVPEDVLEELQIVLTSDAVLSVYDEGTAALAADFIATLFQEVALDASLPRRLLAYQHRVGYIPDTGGLIVDLASYPQLNSFLGTTLSALTRDSRDALESFASGLYATLTDVAVATDTSFIDDVIATALADRPLLSSSGGGTGSGSESYVVKRDARGAAKVAFAGSVPPWQFRDDNADGLADIDSGGYFVGAAGERLTPPTPFAHNSAFYPYRDNFGRAKTSATGSLLYEYRRADRTLSKALLEDAGTILENKAVFDLANEALFALGDRRTVTRTFDSGLVLPYLGIDSSDSGILDMMYAASLLVQSDSFDTLLNLVRVWISSRESALAGISEQVRRLVESLPDFSDAKLTENSTFFDDMMVPVVEIAKVPGLLEDAIAAMANPRVLAAGAELAKQMMHRDSFTYTPSQQILGSYSEVVNRQQKDEGANRSIWQRMLYILSDVAGLSMCNKQNGTVKIIGIEVQRYNECELLKIDDLAVLYIQSLAYAKDDQGNVIYDDGAPRRKATLNFRWNNAAISAAISANPGMIATLTDIKGFGKHPTPDALHRVLLVDPMPGTLSDLMKPPRTRNDVLFYDIHSDALASWEATGFYEKLQPLVQAFADHDKERLLVDLMVVLADHWPSRESNDYTRELGKQGYSWASGLSQFEPLIARALNEGLLTELSRSTAELNNISYSGKKLEDVVSALVRQLVLPQQDLTGRLGNKTSVRNDGTTVFTLSPWQIMADGFLKVKERFATEEQRKDNLYDAAMFFLNIYGRATRVGTSWKFSTASLRGLLDAGVELFQRRWRAQVAAGTLSPWLSGDLYQTIERELTGPMVIGGLDVLAAMAQRSDVVFELSGFASYLSGEGDPNRPGKLAVVSTDGLQFFSDAELRKPVAKSVAKALVPDKKLLLGALDVVAQMQKGDRKGITTDLIRNGLVTQDETTPFGVMVETMAEVLRLGAGDDFGADLSENDFRTMFQGLATFFADERRGLPKILAIIGSRKL